MRSAILAFALGIWVLQQQAELWPFSVYIGVVVLAGGVLGFLLWQSQKRQPRHVDANPRHQAVSAAKLFARFIILFFSFMLGLAWAGAWAQYRLQENLADELIGKDIEVQGVIATLPTRSTQGWHFQFDVEQSSRLSSKQKLPAKLAVSWFDHPANPQSFADLKAGQRWRFTLRVKPIHGNANPYAFDYEAWMLEQGIRASATVRLPPASSTVSAAADDKTDDEGDLGLSSSKLNQRADLKPIVAPPQLIEEFVPGLMLAIERARSALRSKLQANLHYGVERPYAGVLIALVIGDQSGISQRQWALFNRTGIGHLVSISGLHITMIAGLFASLCGFLWRRSCFVGTDWPLLLPVPKVTVIAAAFAALVYVALAGFGVPAQRTLLMLMVMAIAVWTGRSTQASQVLCLALLIVLLSDPWAVLSAGFWLSFAAVAMLLFAANANADHSTDSALDASKPFTTVEGEGDEDLTVSSKQSIWRLWQTRLWPALANAAQAQYAVTIGLVPLSLLLFSQFSLVSPIANAIAIPLVSFVVTPLALASCVLPSSLAEGVLNVAHWCFSVLVQFLEYLASSSWSIWSLPQPSWWIFVLASLGIVCLLAPRGWPLRALGLIYCLPLLTQTASHPVAGQFQVTAFDVGQGTSLLIETSQHRLLYDTGPGSNDESNSGLRVILPYLNGRGIRSLDDVIISHADADHSGGAASVLKGLQVHRIRSSLDLQHELLNPSQDTKSRAEHIRCEAGQSWDWDGVHFEFLHPVPVIYTSDKWKTNARSCTLKVGNAQHSMLLTGDIEAVQEDELVNSIPKRLKADVLVVPHHGSATSSTPAFIQAVKPQFALYQFGYLNRYHHPKPAVWQRYLDFGVIPLRTDTSGAITLQFGDEIKVEHFRQQHRRYWYPSSSSDILVPISP